MKSRGRGRFQKAKTFMKGSTHIFSGYPQGRCCRPFPESICFRVLRNLKDGVWSRVNPCLPGTHSNCSDSHEWIRLGDLNVEGMLRRGNQIPFLEKTRWIYWQLCNGIMVERCWTESTHTFLLPSHFGLMVSRMLNALASLISHGTPIQICLIPLQQYH